MMEEKLPITEELIFMKYEDGADEADEDQQSEIRNGFVFYYPSAHMCKVIEFVVQSEAHAKELQQFEDWICKVLFICNEQMPLSQTKNKVAQAQQTQATQKYCIQAALSILMRTADINQIFSPQTKPEAEETKDISVRKQRRNRQEDNKKQMNQAVTTMKGEIIADKMKNLRIGQDDLKSMNDVKLEIQERLVQVVGHLYTYDE